MNSREIFRKALNDPCLEIKVVMPSEYDKLAHLLKEIPKEAYISEWRHSMGEVRYEYHVHSGDTAERLLELFHDGQRAGNPKLIKIFSYNNLVDITQGVAMG